MKEKSYLKYLFFGVLTFVLILGFSACGDDGSERYEEEIRQLQAQTAEIDKVIEDLKAAKTALTSKTNTLEGDVAEVKELVDGIKVAELDQAIDDLNELKSQLGGNMANFGVLVAAHAKLNALTNNLTTAELEKINKVLTGLSKLETALIGENGEGVTELLNQMAELDLQKSVVEEYYKYAVAKLGVTLTGNAKNDVDAMYDAIMAQIDELKGGSGQTGLEALQAQINGLVDQVAALGSGTTPTQVEEIKKMVITSLGEAISNMITHIELISTSIDPTLVSVITNALNLFDIHPVLFQTMPAQKSWTFFKDYPGSVEFEQDKVASSVKLVVQVTPANATLKKENISLVNSQLKDDINQLVKIADVQPYTDLMAVSRGLNSNGVYEITLALDPTAYNDGGFGKLISGGVIDIPTINVPDINGGGVSLGTINLPDVPNYTKFALAVDSRIDNNVERYALTKFAVIMAAYSGLTPLYSNNTDGEQIKFTVDKISVDSINNRFAASAPDKVWQNPGATYASGFYTDETKNTVNATGDIRKTREPLTIAFDKSFELDFKDMFDGIGFGKAYAYYITLDDSRYNFTGEGAYWKDAMQHIKGINQVYQLANHSKATITISSAAAQGMSGREIGFRVWFVNYDGTLVDPDGRAFYMYCGGVTVPPGASSVDFKVDFESAYTPTATRATSDVRYKTDKATYEPPVDEADQAAFSYAEFKLDMTNSLGFTISIKPDTVMGYNANGDLITTYSGTRLAMKGTGKWSDIKQMRFNNIEPKTLEDGKTYSGSLTFYSALHAPLVIQQITLTKVLPSANEFPEVMDLNTTVSPAGDKFLLYPVWNETDFIKGGNALTKLFVIDPASKSYANNISMRLKSFQYKIWDAAKKDSVLCTYDANPLQSLTVAADSLRLNLNKTIKMPGAAANHPDSIYQYLIVSQKYITLSLSYNYGAIKYGSNADYVVSKDIQVGFRSPLVNNLSVTLGDKTRWKIGSVNNMNDSTLIASQTNKSYATQLTGELVKIRIFGETFGVPKLTGMNISSNNLQISNDLYALDLVASDPILAVTQAVVDGVIATDDAIMGSIVYDNNNDGKKETFYKLTYKRDGTTSGYTAVWVAPDQYLSAPISNADLIITFKDKFGVKKDVTASSGITITN